MQMKQMDRQKQKQLIKRIQVEGDTEETKIQVEKEMGQSKVQVKEDS